MQQNGNQVSGYELEIEDNKLVLRNASELNGAGKLFVYDKQFFFNPVANLYRCDNGKMITTNITIEYENCTSFWTFENEAEGLKTYPRYFNSFEHSDLMTINSSDDP